MNRIIPTGTPAEVLINEKKELSISEFLLKR